MGIATAISSSTPTSVPIEDSTVRHAPKSVIPSSRGGGKALKLGSRTADEDQFLNQLKSEGTRVFLKLVSNLFFLIYLVASSFLHTIIIFPIY